MPEGKQASLVFIATGRLQTTREIQNEQANEDTLFKFRGLSAAMTTGLDLTL